MSKLVLISLVIAVAAAGCGKHADPKGACIVDYDDLGAPGTACTVDTESRCQAGDEPPVHRGGLGSLKMKTFAAGKTCDDVGFTTGGCPDVAIAWSFPGACP